MKTQSIDFSFLNTKAYAIELPSRGLPYSKNSPLSKGTVRIKPWTASIEKTMDRFATGNYYQVLTDIVKASIIENIDVEELTDADLAFILYWARAYTYTTKYNVEINCTGCGNNSKAVIDINDFEITFLDKFENNFTVDVPVDVQKNSPVITMKMRYPRVRDLIKVSSIKRSDLNKMGVQVDKQIYRYALCTEEMILPNENKDILNEETTPNYLNFCIKEIWNKLPASCTLVINDAIDKYKHGYITDVPVKCKECGTISYVTPDLDYSFFRPKRDETGTNKEISNDIQ